MAGRLYTFGRHLICQSLLGLSALVSNSHRQYGNGGACTRSRIVAYDDHDTSRDNESIGGNWKKLRARPTFQALAKERGPINLMNRSIHTPGHFSGDWLSIVIEAGWQPMPDGGCWSQREKSK